MTRQVVADVINAMRFLPQGVALSTPEDLGTGYGVVVPDGCMIEAAGYYEQDSTLKISTAIYAAFSPTDKAAFILHEALYKIARNRLQQTDSARTRQLNAALFASNVSSSVIQALSLMGVDARNPLDVKGGSNFPMISIKIEPETAEPYIFTFTCAGVGSGYGRELGSPVKFSGSGAVILSLPDVGCYSIDGEGRSINSPNPNQARTFKFTYSSGQSKSILIDKFISSSPSMTYLDVTHPEVNVPNIP